VNRFVSAAALALLACGSGKHAGHERGAHDAAVASTTAAPAPTPPAPPALTRADFTGSEACGKCHDKKLAAWRKDWHARALSPAQAALVAGRFPAAFRGSSSAAEMRVEHGAYVMRTAGAEGAADWPIAWLIGGKRMQDTLTELADGRWQVLPVYFHVTGHEWVDYTETKQGALTPEHPFYWTNFRRTANRECLDCHTTGLFVSYDPAARKFDTWFADAGVGCEACHGPGARHAETQDAADIFRPDHATDEQKLAVCGQCHAPRNPLFPLLDAGHRFRPGQRYDDFYQALVVVDGSERSGDYFADGRPRTSSFELTALLESRCYRVGKATCLTCHDAPHTAHGTPDELRAVDPDASCHGCHAQDAAHSKHRSHAAQRCVACHMPPVVSGVLDHFADHALDVPAPAVTAKHGVPNACNACHEHAQDSPAQMDAALARLWPEAARRQARRARLADAIDEATAAQSQDALVAVVGDRDEAPILRGACALLLAQRFPDQAVAAIAPLLRDADALLRARAAAALGHAHPPAPVLERLVVLALTDPSLVVKQAAITSLALLGDSANADAAARALAAHREGGALPQPHVVIGVLALRRGELELAARELERAIALVPYHADARVWLADVYRREGRVEDARVQLGEALRFAPEHAEAKRALAALPAR